MRLLFPIAAVCILSACSLDYGKAVNIEDTVPELKFTEARFTRYEENKPSMEITAGRLEQYKNDGAIYARETGFKSYDEEGKLQTEGSCNLLSADTKNEIYLMFKDIYLHLSSQDLKIFAEMLRYDGKSEQITGRIYDDVTIQKKGTEITGTGFSVSGISKSYSFQSNIDGLIETDDEESKTEDESEGGKNS